MYKKIFRENRQNIGEDCLGLLWKANKFNGFSRGNEGEMSKYDLFHDQKAKSLKNVVIKRFLKH